MGYHTIDLALFVPPELAQQARTWLETHYDQDVEPIALIREDDPDTQAPRYYAVHLQVTPEQFTQIKQLTERPPFAQARMRAGLWGKDTLRRALKEELADRGWRLKR